MNYFREKLTWKDFVIAFVFFLVFSIIFFLCTEYLPDNFSYGWIASVVFGIVMLVWIFALYGWAGGFFCLFILLILMLLV